MRCFKNNFLQTILAIREQNMKSLAEWGSSRNCTTGSEEYYVLHKKSGCTLSPEERLGNKSLRHRQKTNFLSHSLHPLSCQFKTLKPEIYFVRGFQDYRHHELLLVKVKIISGIHGCELQ